MGQSSKGYLYIIIATCAFGTIPVMAKIAIVHGADSTSILLTRFIIVSLFFLAYMKLRNISWRVERKNFWGLIVLGFFIYGNVALFFFLAMKYISPAVGELILYTYPAMVAIGAYFFLGESFSLAKGISLLLAFGGCALVLWGPMGKIDYRGIILAFLTALSYAVYIVGNRKVLDYVHPVVATAYMAVCCSVYFLIYGLTTGEINFHFSLVSFAAMLVLAIWCTIIGMLSFFRGLTLLGATKASITSTFEPVFTVLLSYILLQDTITWIQIGGGAFILCSVLLLQVKEGGKKAEEKASQG